MAFPVDIDGTWIDAGSSLDGGELRRADAGFFNSDGSVYGAVGGVVRHSSAALVTIDGSDNVTILPQSVVIPGNPTGATTPAVGVYRGGLQTSQTNALLTARNATNPRIDLVVAQALDASITGSTNKIRFTLVTGTAAASPAAPTLPFMAVELARINVPALGGGAATVDLSYRKFATAIGSPLMVPTAARLPSTGLPFQRAQALDTGVFYNCNSAGTTWTPEAWQAWTPTLVVTSYALGNGTAVGRYQVIGKTVDCRARITAGTTSNFGSSAPIAVSLPLPMLDANGARWGVGALIGSSNYEFFTYGGTAGASSLPIGYSGANGLISNPVTSTTPASMTAGTVIEWAFSYETS